MVAYARPAASSYSTGGGGIVLDHEYGALLLLACLWSEKDAFPLIRSYLEVVTGSWEEVQAGRWRLVLAAANPNNAVMQVGDLAEIARDAGSDAAFRTRIQDGVYRQELRKRLGHLDDLVAAALTQPIDARGAQPGELNWRFLFSLRVLLLRLQGADTS